MTKEQFAIIGLRIVAIIFIGCGSILLVGNILDTVSEFNPNYLGYYFSTQLLRPVLIVLTGAILITLSKKLGNKISQC